MLKVVLILELILGIILLVGEGIKYFPFSMAAFFRCMKCEYTGFRPGVINHIFVKHRSADQAPYTCTVCQYRGTSEDQMSQHVLHYPPHAKKWAKLEPVQMQTIMVTGFIKHHENLKQPEEGAYTLGTTLTIIFSSFYSIAIITVVVCCLHTYSIY